MAMLGLGDYLCEACGRFDTDGADGNHPSCGLGLPPTMATKDCAEFKLGLPSSYPVGQRRNRRRMREVLAVKYGISGKSERTWLLPLAFAIALAKECGHQVAFTLSGEDEQMEAVSLATYATGRAAREEGDGMYGVQFPNGGALYIEAGRIAAKHGACVTEVL